MDKFVLLDSVQRYTWGYETFGRIFRVLKSDADAFKKVEFSNRQDRYPWGIRGHCPENYTFGGASLELGLFKMTHVLSPLTFPEQFPHT